MMPVPGQRPWERAIPGLTLAASWTGGWPGACAVVCVVALIAVYRLLAEQSRRRLLLDIYLNAPSGTEVVRLRVRPS